MSDISDWLADESPNLPAWVVVGIQSAVRAEPPRPVTIPSRFPFTYAYDYLSANAEHFRVPGDAVGSRSAVGGWLSDQLGVHPAPAGTPLVRVCAALARLYIAANGLDVTPETRDRMNEIEEWIVTAEEAAP